jgi:uncharacterized integral membrane protein
MSIGRETFWTVPHMLMQGGALLSCLACMYVILSTTFTGDLAQRNSSIRVLGLSGPSGAFIAFWGSFAMMASAPLDNWWHNAYGLDSLIGTPPHMLSSLGYFATHIGTMAWISSVRNRSGKASRDRLTWLILLVGATSVVLLAILTLGFTLRTRMHTATCYLAVALAIPGPMIAARRASGHRWGCTIVALIYTFIQVAEEWLMPLFSAQPKLGPVYHNVTHLIPPPFPLLLIVPAITIDLLLRRTEQRPAWLKALWIGPAFVLSFLAAQWPFGSFLMSPASRNWVFGTTYFAYFDPAGVLYNANVFRIIEKTRAEFTWTMITALVVSILTTLLGLGWGDWIRRVRR